MNSFFIQPTIDEKIRSSIAEQIRTMSQKSRLEAEVWQTSEIHKGLTAALSQSSPTIIAVGSRAWLDRIITATHILGQSDKPAFGHIPTIKTYHPTLAPFMIKRVIQQSLSSFAARKVSHMAVFQLNSALFTETCSIGLPDLSHSFLAKFALQLHQGTLNVSSQATRIEISMIEGIHDDLPLLRLGVRTERLSQTASTVKTSFLPENRTALKTNRYEDALHLPFEKGTISTREKLVCMSHPEIDTHGPLTLQTHPKKLKFITSKNQPYRY